jgi:hypothetical protein
VTSDLARRRSLLTAALGFALVDTKGKPLPKEIQLVREWLNNWKASDISPPGWRVRTTISRSRGTN